MSKNTTGIGTEQSFELGQFQFENGESTDSLRIGYTAYGTLNSSRSNLLVITPGTANTRHSAAGYIGPGRAFDTNKFFVVATDAIGAGTSSKPSDGLFGNFPKYNIRDLVNAQYAFIRSAFGVNKIAYLAGASMGAFQALEWSIQYPDSLKNAILMVPATRAGNIFRAAVKAAIEAVRLDPEWRNGKYSTQPAAGLCLAGRLYFPWTVTDSYIAGLSEPKFEQELQRTVTRATQWDAWDFIRRYEASASHDIGEKFSGNIALALSRVKARLLILPSSTDRLLPVKMAQEIASHVVNATYCEIPSELGHLAWRPVAGATESQIITKKIQTFIAEGELD